MQRIYPRVQRRPWLVVDANWWERRQPGRVQYLVVEDDVITAFPDVPLYRSNAEAVRHGL
jgi:hypothetical protein